MPCQCHTKNSALRTTLGALPGMCLRRRDRDEKQNRRRSGNAALSEPPALPGSRGPCFNHRGPPRGDSRGS